MRVVYKNVEQSDTKRASASEQGGSTSFACGGGAEPQDRNGCAGNAVTIARAVMRVVYKNVEQSDTKRASASEQGGSTSFACGGGAEPQELRWMT
jgi:hypothetical protein